MAAYSLQFKAQKYTYSPWGHVYRQTYQGRAKVGTLKPSVSHLRFLYSRYENEDPCADPCEIHHLRLSIVSVPLPGLLALALSHARTAFDDIPPSCTRRSPDYANRPSPYGYTVPSSQYQAPTVKVDAESYPNRHGHNKGEHHNHRNASGPISVQLSEHNKRC